MATQFLGPDHYDADECFDDIAPRKVSRREQVRAAREIVRQASVQRLPPPLMQVEPAHGDVREVEVEDVLEDLLGSDGKTFSPLHSAKLPIAQRLHRQYASAMPAPKIMRVDDEESYAEWMNGRRRPYEAELEHRLAELEQAVAEHVADNHGGGRIERLEKALAKHGSDGHGVAIDVLGAAVEDARSLVAVCGEEIPLSLEPGTEDFVKCWQDGPMIYVSMRLPGPGGKARIATAASPLERHVEEVLGYVADAGLDPVAVMGLVPLTSQMLGGGALITQISGAASDLVKLKGPVKVSPKSDPAVAAVMSLLQLAQKDREAAHEVRKLRAMKGSEPLFAAAEAGFRDARQQGALKERA